MIIDVYLFMASVSVLFMVLSFVKKEIVVFDWLAFILMSVTSLMSANIEVITCTATACNPVNFESIGLIWMWSGLGLLMFIMAVYDTFLLFTGQIQESTEGKRTVPNREV